MTDTTAYCPVEATLSVIGGKWKVLIIWHLNETVLRFGELRRLMPATLTQQMLTQQLRELEKDGIIERKVFAEVPPHVEYSLTEFGNTLRPVLKEMAEWGTAHQSRAESR